MQTKSSLSLRIAAEFDEDVQCHGGRSFTFWWWNWLCYLIRVLIVIVCSALVGHQEIHLKGSHTLTQRSKVDENKARASVWVLFGSNGVLSEECSISSDPYFLFDPILCWVLIPSLWRSYDWREPNAPLMHPTNPHTNEAPILLHFDRTFVLHFDFLFFQQIYEEQHQLQQN